MRACVRVCEISAMATARLQILYMSWPREVLALCPPIGRETFSNFTPPEISLQRLQLETSNFYICWPREVLAFVMPDYPPIGRGQEHVTHFTILHPVKYLWND